MKCYDIACMPGDGIGPEIVRDTFQRNIQWFLQNAYL